jgi:hypothetical protein
MNLNVNYKSNHNQNSLMQKMNQLFSFYGFKQLVDEPTYVTSDKILDLVFTNSEQSLNNLQIIPNIFQSCDHKAVYFEIKIAEKPKITTETKTFYNYNESNLKTINTELFKIEWNRVCVNSVYPKNIFVYSYYGFLGNSLSKMSSNKFLIS